MELIGYISLGMMGMTLSIIGAGGSILTIPILVYLLRIPIILATSYSLIIVGSTALVAAIRYRKHILFVKSLNFVIFSILGVFGTRYFIIPTLPNFLWGMSIDKLLIVLLIIFMIIAGYFMVKSSSYVQNNDFSNKFPKVAFIALALGIIMGLLGAGGGFLIIPTLIFIMGFSMQQAVPTSLFIVTINSFIGFAADKHNLMASDWVNLLKYLICALFGMVIGIYITKITKHNNLKKSFGYFVWVIGVVIFTKEFIL